MKRKLNESPADARPSFINSMIEMMMSPIKALTTPSKSAILSRGDYLENNINEKKLNEKESNYHLNGNKNPFSKDNLPFQFTTFRSVEGSPSISTSGHSRYTSSNFSKVPFGRIGKDRARLSVLKQHNNLQKSKLLTKLAEEHVLSFHNAAKTGFNGSENDFNEVREYMKKVYIKSADLSIDPSSLSLEDTPIESGLLHKSDTDSFHKKADQIIEKITAKEDLWLKIIREKIDSILQNKHEPEPLMQAHTPLYDQLQKKKEVKRFDNFPKLTGDALEKIKEALGPGAGVVVDQFNVEINKNDIRTLQDGKWLNDEIINFYGQLIMKRASKDSSLPQVHFFNTFFYSSLKEGGFDKVKRWTRRVIWVLCDFIGNLIYEIDLFSKDFVIIPIHLGMHWCCSIINFKQKRFEYYDSLHASNPTCLKILRCYLSDEHQDKKKTPIDLSDWTDYSPKDIPAQQNGYDCGVFTCIFAEYCSREEPFDFSQKDMVYYRKRIVFEILTAELLIKDHA